MPPARGRQDIDIRRFTDSAQAINVRGVGDILAVAIDKSVAMRPYTTLALACQGCSIDFLAIFIGHPDELPANLARVSIPTEPSCQSISVGHR